MLGQDIIEQASKPVVGPECEVISFLANGVGGTAESIDDRIETVVPGLVGRIVAIEISNPAGGAACWLRTDAVLGAATASAGIAIAAGANERFGWQPGSLFLLETAHTVYLLLYRS